MGCQLLVALSLRPCNVSILATNAASLARIVTRLDLGYDDTSFSRMEVAVKERLPNDASKQRQNNLSTLEAPHTSHRDIEICGTELRQMLLRDFADAPGATKKTAEKWALDSGSYPSVESELMYTDQRVASWARRYSRKNPM